MPLVIILYSVLAILLFCGWEYTGKRFIPSQTRILNVIFCLILICIVTFRNGKYLPDYDNYIEAFNALKYNADARALELSFKSISKIAYILGGNSLWMFAIYASLSVGIRYYAIHKYAPFVVFSLAAWVSSFFLLHDLIQIRGAVASALLLLIIPLIYRKNYLGAIILWVIALFFHRSAIAFLPIFFFRRDSGHWRLWLFALSAVILFNLLKIDIVERTGIAQITAGLQLLEGDIYSLANSSVDYLPNPFAPYTFLQIITTVLCIVNIKQIEQVFPEAKLFVKTALTGLIIYCLPLGVISTRISELLLSSIIMLYPCAIFWYRGRYAKVLGRATIVLICLFILTDFIFLQNMIYLPMNTIR